MAAFDGVDEDEPSSDLRELWSGVRDEIDKLCRSADVNSSCTELGSNTEKQHEALTIQHACRLQRLLGELLTNDFSSIVDGPECDRCIRMLYNVIFIYKPILSSYHIQHCDAAWNARLMIYLVILFLKCMHPENSTKTVSQDSFLEMIDAGLMCVDKPVCEYTVVDMNDSVKLLEVSWTRVKVCRALWEYVDALEMRIASLSCLVHSYHLDASFDCVMNCNKIVMNHEEKTAGCSDDTVSEWCETILDIVETRTANKELRKVGLTVLGAGSSFSTNDLRAGFLKWISKGIRSSESNEVNLRQYMLKHSLRPGEYAHYEKRKLGIHSYDYDNILSLTRANYNSQQAFDQALSELETGRTTYETCLLALAHFDHVCALNMTDEPGWWLKHCIWGSQKILFIGRSDFYETTPTILSLAGNYAVLTEHNLVLCDDAVEAIIVWALIQKENATSVSALSRASQSEVEEEALDEEEEDAVSQPFVSKVLTKMRLRSRYLDRVISCWERGLDNDDLENLSWGLLK